MSACGLGGESSGIDKKHVENGFHGDGDSVLQDTILVSFMYLTPNLGHKIHNHHVNQPQSITSTGMSRECQEAGRPTEKRIRIITVVVNTITIFIPSTMTLTGIPPMVRRPHHDTCSSGTFSSLAKI